jgi:hypothetical protein
MSPHHLTIAYKTPYTFVYQSNAFWIDTLSFILRSCVFNLDFLLPDRIGLVRTKSKSESLLQRTSLINGRL